MVNTIKTVVTKPSKAHSILNSIVKNCSRDDAVECAALGAITGWQTVVASIRPSDTQTRMAAWLTFLQLSNMESKALKMINLESLCHPHMDDTLYEVSGHGLQTIQKEARRLLETKGTTAVIKARCQEILDGKLPAPWRVAERVTP